MSGTGTGSLIPLPSRERGIGGCFVVTLPYGYCLKASMTGGIALPLWIADQVRNDVTMLMHGFTLTLALSHQGRGDSVGWCCIVVTQPCGYCLEASMTGWAPRRPVDSRVGGNDGRFCKGLLNGEESKGKSESNDRLRWLD